MGLMTADRYPQYNGVYSQTVTGAVAFTVISSSDFNDVLMTGAVPAGSVTPGLRFTSVKVFNTGSVAIEVIWSQDAAVLSGKSAAETIIIPPGKDLEVDLYPYSTVDPTDPSIVYGPRALGFRADRALTFTGTGVGTGSNLASVRINAGFLGV